MYKNSPISIDKLQKLVSDYKAGKQQALKALMGKTMGMIAGKANPVILEEIIKKII